MPLNVEDILPEKYIRRINDTHVAATARELKAASDRFTAVRCKYFVSHEMIEGLVECGIVPAKSIPNRYRIKKPTFFRRATTFLDWQD